MEALSNYAKDCNLTQLKFRIGFLTITGDGKKGPSLPRCGGKHKEPSPVLGTGNTRRRVTYGDTDQSDRAYFSVRHCGAGGVHGKQIGMGRRDRKRVGERTGGTGGGG